MKLGFLSNILPPDTSLNFTAAVLKLLLNIAHFFNTETVLLNEDIWQNILTVWDVNSWMRARIVRKFC